MCIVSDILHESDTYYMFYMIVSMHFMFLSCCANDANEFPPGSIKYIYVRYAVCGSRLFALTSRCIY